MAYVDEFTKRTYLDESDPLFVEGVSPAISAENLNAIQDGVISSLEASDAVDARCATNETDIASLEVHTNNIRCEIANKTVTVPITAWTENVVAMRKEATISDAQIRTDTDVELMFTDAQNGKFSIQVMRPASGSIMIYTTDTIPSEALEFTMVVTEVRAYE